MPQPRRDFYNAIAFKLDSRHVFGKLEGEVKIAPGLEPSVVQLLVPKPEFDKLNGDYTGIGDLEFYFKNDPRAQPPVPDFALANWVIYEERPTQWGKLDPNGPFVVVERVLTLVDARRKWRKGRGGVVTVGLYNKSGKDGQPVLAPGGGFAHTMTEAITICLSAMGLTSLGGRIPVRLNTVEAPRDLKWDAAHAPGELDKLLELAGLVFVLLPDGNFDIREIGPRGPNVPPPQIAIPNSVSDPAPIGTHELPYEESKVGEDRPELVIVTSAPHYAVEQATLTGPDPATIDFVGYDPAGNLKPYSEIPYALSQFNVAAILRGELPGVPLTPQQEHDVRRWAFRMLAMNTSPTGINAGRLPILMRIVDLQAAGPIGAEIAADVPPTLLCRIPIITNTGLGSGDSIAPIDVPFKVVNSELGQLEVTTRGPVGRLQGITNDFLVGYQQPQYGDVRFTFAFERRAAANWWERFYCSAWRMDNANNDAVQVNPYDPVAMRAAVEDPDAYFVPAPELRLFYIDGVVQNRVSLDDQAKPIAKAVLKKGIRNASTRRYRGFHEFVCDGLISSVSWNQDQLMTTVEVNRHYVGGSKLLQETVIRPLKEAAEKWRRKHHEDQQVQVGSRDYYSVEPPVAAPLTPDPQFWAIIGNAIGAAAPFEYEFREKLNNNTDGPRTHAAPLTRLINHGEDDGRRDPDGTSTLVVYPPIKPGTRVRVLGYDAIAQRWYFDATPQPKRGPCN